MSDLTRLEELLVARVTEGVAGEEAMELHRLLAAEPGWEEEEFELAAAALDLALSRGEEPMPEEVRNRLRKSVVERARSEAAGSAPKPVDLASRRSEPRPARTALPWLAAAAALVVALIGWWPRIATAPPTPVVAPSPPTVAELRQELGAREGTLALDWSTTEDPAAGGASGDVVWNASAQKGYMRFRGLAANEPTREQYQLWIFDKERDERFPVDGGVFDIPAGADEVLVPIDPKLPVDEPVLFAVTVEKPGGVVVSSRERIVLVAGV